MSRYRAHVDSSRRPRSRGCSRSADGAKNSFPRPPFGGNKRKKKDGTPRKRRREREEERRKRFPSAHTYALEMPIVNFIFCCSSHGLDTCKENFVRRTPKNKIRVPFCHVVPSMYPSGFAVPPLRRQFPPSSSLCPSHGPPISPPPTTSPFSPPPKTTMRATSDGRGRRKRLRPNLR